MKINKLNNEELEIWLSLARTVGPIKFFSILRAYGSLNEASKYLNRLANNKKIYSIQDAQKEINDAQKIGARIIPACDPDYPDLLRNVLDCPPVITVLGDVSLLSREIIAIIGGRNSSMNGRNFANKLALDLSEAGFVTVSGLAKGIDTAANSVIYKNYPTIAVIASGIDIVYPKENFDLYKKITENGGLVITELPFSIQPKPQYFPQRNRIISGVSLGVAVVEASKHSGSLITANFALNQGREVFAVSGFPLDSRCSGSNYLIKNGAKLIESAEDIIESIRFNLPMQQKSLFEIEHYSDSKLDQETVKKEKLQQAKSVLADHINSVPVDVDELILESGLPTNIALMAILELELENRIERSPGNKISLVFSTDC
ncbi:DNA-processing protein DprA [Wolbachia endosymbiont of Folsomia candida]|uniref:DNA-processing protein DprA n=1 Tax=Wolbachia endosymbiont of Folsomia candida TaxID=169402 RepID=UPI000B622513|nr:DNA-processing protein DprA [Wolbachia endosymbiont of Folsomia candida]APR99197.1 DNA-protecting protein DprA [Wolbachia endosymbiont of Folsomia candida]